MTVFYFFEKGRGKDRVSLQGFTPNHPIKMCTYIFDLHLGLRFLAGFLFRTGQMESQNRRCDCSGGFVFEKIGDC